jgi:hypothetical protein
MRPEELQKLKDEIERLEKEHGEGVKQLSEKIPADELLAHLKEVEQKEEQLVKRWSEECSENELLARIEARTEEMEAQMRTCREGVGALQALQRIIQQHPTMPLSELITMLEAKTTKTPEERQALGAWNTHFREN